LRKFGVNIVENLIKILNVGIFAGHKQLYLGTFSLGQQKHSTLFKNTEDAF